MAKAPNPYGALIDLIGADVVRNHFGLSPQRLWNWRNDAIPYKYRPTLAKLAMLNGVAVPDGFLFPESEAA